MPLHSFFSLSSVLYMFVILQHLKLLSHLPMSIYHIQIQARLRHLASWHTFFSPTTHLNHQYLVMRLDQLYFVNYDEPSKLDYTLCKQDHVIVDVPIGSFSLSEFVMSYNFKIY
ncbi:unnamed protein product [Musa textilis]